MPKKLQYKNTVLKDVNYWSNSVFLCVKINIQNWRKQYIADYQKKVIVFFLFANDIKLRLVLFVGSESWPPLLSSWLIFTRRLEMKWNRIIRRKWRRWSWSTWERWTASNRNAKMRSGLCLQLDANERIRNVADFNFKEEALLIPPNSVLALCSEAELGVFTAERERAPGGLPFWATGEPPFAVWQADGTDEDGSLPKGENSRHVIQDFSVKKQFRRSERRKELIKPDEMLQTMLFWKELFSQIL